MEEPKHKVFTKYKDYIRKIIAEHFSNLGEDENAIVILQEVPYKTKTNGNWHLHPVFTEFKNDYKEDSYDTIYLADTSSDK